MTSNDFSTPPQRVVSLVPSLTESCLVLGMGERLVGRTEYCIYPEDKVKTSPVVGGTKNPDLEQIIALNPDLVLINQEENTPEVVAALDKAKISVWVTFPKTVSGALNVLYDLAGIFQVPTAFLSVKSLEQSLELLLATINFEKLSYFCPIWHDTSGDIDWWMTFNGDTYSNDLLALMGGRNILEDRVRRYPLHADLSLMDATDPQERDTRYPRVPANEIIAADPEMILLPSEPFAFDESHQAAAYEIFSETKAAKNNRIHLLDGSLITWHGVRLATAIRELQPLFL
jgi:ABC-type hemin transport system substrate-binding protein